jgi:hypothetical protein
MPKISPRRPPRPSAATVAAAFESQLLRLDHELADLKNDVRIQLRRTATMQAELRYLRNHRHQP